MNLRTVLIILAIIAVVIFIVWAMTGGMFNVSVH